MSRRSLTGWGLALAVALMTSIAPMAVAGAAPVDGEYPPGVADSPLPPPSDPPAAPAVPIDGEYPHGLADSPLPPPPPPPPVVVAPQPPPAPVAPAPAGAGRKIVYSNSQQRVWLYESDGGLAKTHLVSGRRGVPRPGTYRVFSKSPVAWSTGGARLAHMVRFARGTSLAIGFHAIPVGRRGPIQSLAELGQFRSLGCVRQAPSDAAFLYNFAPIGTTVVVTP